MSTEMSTEVLIESPCVSGTTADKVGKPVGNNPQSYKADPQLVRSKIYAKLASGFSAHQIDDLRREIDSYNAVFLGRIDMAEINGVTDLMEFATAVLSRYSEIEGLILRGENEHLVGFGRGSEIQRFRTGELRSAIRIAEAQADLGSRRLTYATMIEGLRYRP